MMLDTSCFGGIVIVLLFNVNVHWLIGARLNLVTSLLGSANFFTFDRLVILLKQWTIWGMSSGHFSATACSVFTIHVSRWELGKVVPFILIIFFLFLSPWWGTSGLLDGGKNSCGLCFLWVALDADLSRSDLYIARYCDIVKIKGFVGKEVVVGYLDVVVSCCCCCCLCWSGFRIIGGSRAGFLKYLDNVSASTFFFPLRCCIV